MSEQSKALEAFEARIGEKFKKLEQLRDGLNEIDGFITKHRTIGTDEDNARIQDRYKEYEGLVDQFEAEKTEIEKIVEECRLATGCAWTVSFGEDFTFELKKD